MTNITCDNHECKECLGGKCTLSAIHLVAAPSYPYLSCKRFVLCGMEL